MSIFASQTTSSPIPIPFDPPHTITIRRLTGQEIERAQAESLRGVVEGRSARQRVRFMAAVLGHQEIGERELRAALDPLVSFDRFTLARCGLVAWTYERDVVQKNKQTKREPLPIDDQTVGDLDDEALEFIATEVLKRSKPALFQTVEEMDADRKNG